MVDRKKLCARPAWALGALIAIAGCTTRTRVVPSTQDEVVMRLRVRAAATEEEVEEVEEEVDLTCRGGGPDGLAVTDIAAGYGHMCIVLSDGTARCWGRGNEGTLGTGSRARSATPARVEGLTGLISIGTGRMHSCALDEQGHVHCWGGSGYRQVGFPISGSSTDTPGRVRGLRGVVQLGVGYDHSCAVTHRGQVYCWGRNQSGQVGDGSRDRHERAVVVPRVRATYVAAGQQSTCAVTASATVVCWGAIAGSARPTVVSGLPAPAVTVTVGHAFACARLADGSVHCWGDGTHGQLGPAERGFSDTPVPVEGLPPALTVHAWGTQVCATDVQHQAWCWGSSEPFDADSANPRLRAYMDPVDDAAIGRTAVCARLSEGGLCCWGSNINGLLGTVRQPFANPPWTSEIPVPMLW